MARIIAIAIVAVAVSSGAACSDDEEQTSTDVGVEEDVASEPGDTSDTGEEAAEDTGADSVEDASDDTGHDVADVEEVDDGLTHLLGHTFEPYHLQAGDETTPCVQWRLENEEALYVNSVTMSNEGGFHHSNWYIVPDNHFGQAHDDGYFECADRDWSEQEAALMGTVLFAQSTQAYTETQQFPEGVVTKIPPNHMIVSDLHFLNTGTQDLETRMRLELELLHPELVETVVTPFQLIYEDLDIPPESESRFEAACDIADEAGLLIPNTDGGFDDLELYYVLPHYHDLGNHFDVHIYGGPNDGEQLFELTGFNAEANGQTFDPPVDMEGAKGLRFSCGYDNPRSESVGWGIGDQEMCTMLGFSNAEAVVRTGVSTGDTDTVETDEDGIVHHTGPCETLVVPRSPGQSMPTQDEIEADLYIPDSGTTDDFSPERECVDTPETAQPLREPTLSNIEADIFEVGCSFSACHGSGGAGAGLALVGDDLHDNLLHHDVLTPTDLPMVDPGNAEGSWLYRVMSECEPQADVGTVAFMPRNSPTLFDPALVAMVRDWIDEGAPDN